jgi:hypothetical protein
MRTTIAIALLIVLAALPVSAGIVTRHVGTDAEMLSYIQTIAFVAEGRIGDRGGAATFELDLGADTGNPATTAQYGWQSGVAEPFTVSYNKITNVATFTLGGRVLTYSPAVSFKEFFVRTRAVDANTSVQVYALVLNGVSVGDLSAATGPDDLDILAVSGVDLYQGFTLTGVAVLTWTGTPPTQSRLAFQIKVGNAPTVPSEESTWGKIKGLYQ